MILTTHAIVGAGVAQLFPNHPVAGFLAGVVSHYLSDTVPHWDYGRYFSSIKSKNDGRRDVLEEISFGPHLWFEASIFLFDLVFGFWLAWWLWQNLIGGGSTLLILAGALGGILPDLWQIVYAFWKNKFTNALQKIHSFTHTPEKFEIKNVYSGVILQAIFVVLAVVVVRLLI